MQKINLSILAIIITFLMIIYFVWANNRKGAAVNNDSGPVIITPQDSNYHIGDRA